MAAMENRIRVSDHQGKIAKIELGYKVDRVNKVYRVCKVLSD